MATYIIRKLLYSILVLIGVITVTFCLMYVIPGDPARLMLGQRADIASIDAVRKQLGLDEPLYVQYGAFMLKAVQGDLGRSYSSNRDVLTTILDTFPATALLAVSALILSSIIGILIGVISSVKPYTFADNLSMLVALFGISFPPFALGLIMALVFGAWLKWFPISGYINNGMSYLVLPMLTLALRPLAIIARLTRSSMLDVLGQDYVRTARAKGVSEWKVIIRHALRNALNPVITTISAWLAALLGGTFFIEYIFNWPGIGLLAINSILSLDFPMIQGTVLFTAVIFIIVNMIVDVIYAFLDPKVKLS
ncbi:MAG TPA: ABC transporter permease [Ignavibacteria bacterium]|nr:ABC transporter permease [Ignavibacteria bacterium]HRF66552.1 ABC transporter permease [Ignavibacteria bacterium]HRJ03719.1 ABC transporter permease [Ignavibacteria bacterium]HRJ85731.1 ABC transporter permease [Ignavibacteria bacterium]